MHPGRTDLALYAGGDLGWWLTMRVRLHVARCGECREEVEAFRAAGAELRRAAGPMPSEVNWNRLAAEMRANIHVGLAAGECVGPVEAGANGMGWRAALASACVAVIVLASWWLVLPQPGRLLAPRQTGTEPLPEPGPAWIEATSQGVGLKENGRALTLRHPGGLETATTVGFQGALRMRYVDEESGQVTINNVYLDE